MGENLLLDLENGPASERLGRVDALVAEIKQAVARTVEGMHGSVLLFENAWRNIVMEVARGKTAEMHAARSRLWTAFSKRLELLQHTHELARWLGNLDPDCLPNSAILAPEITGLEQMKARIFAGWQTAEDLEDLAARDYPLTTADLERIAPDRHNGEISLLPLESKARSS